MPGFPVLHYLLEFAQTLAIESVVLSNQLILCCPLLLLPSIFPSIRVFSNELALHIIGCEVLDINIHIMENSVQLISLV